MHRQKGLAMSVDDKKDANENNGVFTRKEAFELLERVASQTDFSNEDEYEQYVAFSSYLANYLKKDPDKNNTNN